ncbi:MAG TPA: hypothetical protein VLA09_13720 [Longimicrobiales bacterium]|nr:hypothetical protein [Longimicrobiales bacterium]
MRATFRAVAAVVVPAAARLDPPGWAELESIAEGALAGRSPAVRRQLVLFLRLVEAWALLRHGRRLGSLPPGRARAFLESLGRSRLLAVRRGVWGVRTLAFMGYYGRPRFRAEVGYRATREGWDARGGSAGPWRDRAAAAAPEPVVLDVLTAAGEDA